MSHLLSRLRDKFTIKGALYASIGVLGIGYEVGFRKSPELMVIILYSAIIGIGIITMFRMKDKT